MIPDLRQRIKDVRPQLVRVDPKSFYISWVFVAFNIILGIYLVFTPLEPLQVPIVTSLFNNLFWAMAFIGLGVWLMFELVNNEWAGIRSAMIAGLFIKTVWAYALLFLGFRVGFIKELSTLAMWLTIAAIQAIVAIYFLPKDILVVKHGKSAQ